MPQQEIPKQELTLSEKMQVVQYLAIFPALSLMVFIRRKLGYRMLKPNRIIGIGMFLGFIDSLFQSFGHPLGVLFTEFYLAMMLLGFFQRFRRWRELCRGECWHTMSPGISYLELVPLPAFIRNQRRIYRFVEPALCFIAAMLIGIFFSQPLARWIAFSAIALFIYEQSLYEKQLDRDLDVLDGLIASEVHAETVEFFAGGQTEEKERTIKETSGIPTGVAFDIHKQIEKLRAKQTADQEQSQAEAFVRQVEKIKVAAAASPKNITPAVAELPPTKQSAPDNLVREEPPKAPM